MRSAVWSVIAWIAWKSDRAIAAASSTAQHIAGANSK
jgi:hypothetical protein